MQCQWRKTMVKRCQRSAWAAMLVAVAVWMLNLKAVWILRCFQSHHCLAFWRLSLCSIVISVGFFSGLLFPQLKYALLVFSFFGSLFRCCFNFVHFVNGKSPSNSNHCLDFISILFRIQFAGISVVFVIRLTQRKKHTHAHTKSVRIGIQFEKLNWNAWKSINIYTYRFFPWNILIVMVWLIFFSFLLFSSCPPSSSFPLSSPSDSWLSERNEWKCHEVGYRSVRFIFSFSFSSDFQI